MANNRQIAWNKKAAPYVTAALALEVVSLFGFAYLTDSHVPGISPLAATSIFIDGTKDIIPTTSTILRKRPRPDEETRSAARTTNAPVFVIEAIVYIQYQTSTRGNFGILTDGVGYKQVHAGCD